MRYPTALEVAAAVREACFRAAAAAWEDAGMAGLCAEGRWERALDALRTVDLEHVLTMGAKQEWEDAP
jgi:hypothetical protein